MIRIAAFLLAPALIAAQVDPTASTRFTRNAAAFEAKQQQIVDAYKAQSPQAGAEIEQVFAQDILGILAPELKRMGLDSQDMVDMTAAYWVLAWEASHGIANTKTDPALMQGARRQLAGVMAKNPDLAKLSERDRQDLGDTMLLQALLIDLRMQAAAKAGAAQTKQMSDVIYGEASKLLNVDLRKIALTNAGFSGDGAPGGAGAATPASAAPTKPTIGAAAHSENWKGVDGVYFKSYTSFGVGGMMIQDFEPVVLFKDGTYYEVEGPAIEDIDLAERRRAKPQYWGRWSRTAAGFSFIDDKGKPSQEKLQDGRFYKAFSAEAAGNKLAAPYYRLSGGGNTAMGGSSMVVAQTDLTFLPNGSFSRKGFGGGSDSGQYTGGSVVAYGKNASVGRYEIKNHTITMTQPDGSTKREFFAFGSQKNPPIVDIDMAFFGDRVFIVRSK